jgi:CBS domain-containing protein
MAPLREMRLVQAYVPRAATFLEAAKALFGSGISAIAVVDAELRVVGLFTDDELLRGLFPGYLADLHHTAFLREESGGVAARLEQARRESVDRYMREPVVVDIDATGMHVAERFLHSPWGALAVVEGERFIGMVDQIDFVRSLMKKLGLD